MDLREEQVVLETDRYRIVGMLTLPPLALGGPTASARGTSVAGARPLPDRRRPPPPAGGLPQPPVGLRQPARRGVLRGQRRDGHPAGRHRVPPPGLVHHGRPPPRD